MRYPHYSFRLDCDIANHMYHVCVLPVLARASVARSGLGKGHDAQVSMVSLLITPLDLAELNDCSNACSFACCLGVAINSKAFIQGLAIAR